MAQNSVEDILFNSESVKETIAPLPGQELRAPSFSAASFPQRSAGSPQVMRVVFCVLFIVAAGLAGWYGMKIVSTTTLPVLSPTPTPTTSSPQVLVPPVSPPAVRNSAAVLPPPPLDSDGDGLTDEEEKKLGTDPFKSDTDADSLSDFEEGEVWFTDPLNPDTDGDGYQDGDEVTHGYNPKGMGRLQ